MDPRTRGPLQMNQLVADFKAHGFCMTEPVVPADLTDSLQNEATAQATDMLRHGGNRGDGRTCLNRNENIEYTGWYTMLNWLVDEKSPTAQVFTQMFGDAWWFDRSGGDAVCAGAGFDSPCVPHSDWKVGKQQRGGVDPKVKFKIGHESGLGEASDRAPMRFAIYKFMGSTQPLGQRTPLGMARRECRTRSSASAFLSTTSPRAWRP